MPFPVEMQHPTLERTPVMLEPAHNAITSMMLVIKEDEMPGVHEWVSRTRNALSVQEFQRHKLVIIGFYYALLPKEHWNSFPEYLDHFEKMDPQVLRSNLLEEYATICIECGEYQLDRQVDWEKVLSSAQEYIKFLKEHFGEAGVDEELESQAYQYVLDPPSMKTLIAGYLRWFWEQHLSREWTRVEPVLRESVRQFQNVGLPRVDSLEEARLITGQDLPEENWKKLLERAQQVIYVPNPHIGLYVYKMLTGNLLWIVFGAHQPESADIRIPELDRADIIARVSALADDTRLRILQMVGEQGEMRSQDIMEKIELSQPSISRYLTQLTATGYLQERRVNGAKAYTLNRDRIEKNFKAIHKFLLGT